MKTHSMPETPVSGTAVGASRRHSLTRQLALLAVLPALLAALGTAALLTHQYLGDVKRLIHANAHNMALQLAASAQEPLERMDWPALERLAQSGLQQPHVQAVEVLAGDGAVLAYATRPQNGKARQDGGRFQAVVPLAGDEATGRLLVEVDLQTLASARRTVWLNVAIILAASVLGVVLAGIWAVRRIHSPIRQLVQAMDRLGADEDIAVPLRGPAEIQRLQARLNQAARALAESRNELKTRIAEATAELARKNQQLQTASQAKTRLLAAASHDLRQPLHALTLFSDGLADGETNPARLTRIQHIQACVESLDRLFSELLNLSQLDAGVLRPQWSDFPLDQLFDDISRTFRPVAEQRELRLVVRKTDVWVRSDYVMLTRILSNIVSNALRHTQQGGVLVGARWHGRTLRIEVWDTGTGIAPEHQSRVFEEFYQVDPQRMPAAQGTHGMGLGLFTVARLAGLLNTRVALKSRPGRGTCMSVNVRSVAVRNPRATPVPLVQEQRLDGITVLVIDDEGVILEGLQAMLTHWGAQVLTAQDRAQVLALAREWDRAPDVIVSDLLLQGGDSGLSVLAALEAQGCGVTPATPRLLVTGETQPEHLRDAASAGIAVLHKPVAPRLLRRAILALASSVRPNRD